MSLQEEKKWSFVLYEICYTGTGIHFILKKNNEQKVTLYTMVSWYSNLANIRKALNTNEVLINVIFNS